MRVFFLRYCFLILGFIVAMSGASLLADPAQKRDLAGQSTVKRPLLSDSQVAKSLEDSVFAWGKRREFGSDCIFSPAADDSTCLPEVPDRVYDGKGDLLVPIGDDDIIWLDNELKHDE
jgi:hypothetical protein